MIYEATLSPDGRYRYRLTRLWGDGPPATFVMLNPSTADAYVDDPTIRRCIGFAKAWHCGGLVVVNLYGYRATRPQELWTVDDPVGPQNDHHLLLAMMDGERDGGPVIAAWGAHARADRVKEISLSAEACRIQLQALKITKSGAPGHPLYLPAGARPFPWPVAQP